ncbi:MAG: DUF370 domain-containing protein [Deltaproteobacteria bacterium]|nr:DUF370 domain-containing protein [Deltaproteobacteria bacterium]MBW1719411.1 DUF370 domain-containing protein [Deltaproteobacteria bacterium]MBW1932752.1 DUF370 domain-containing protein [Deltaproteobacteria bacterium]MBW1938825.1 DUF370 domain-containing protein [Deltaproteobacteria bacterium]MBW1965056.1 DUF370 domain-containing protein [Deltaproteobacteria bacterium]
MSCRCKLLNIGFGNTIVAERVVAIVNPSSAPMKRLREEAKVNSRLIDASQGRRTRSIIITDSNHIILSAIQAETISQRLGADVLTKSEEKDPKY